MTSIISLPDSNVRLEREWIALHAFVHNQQIAMNNIQINLATAHEANAQVHKDRCVAEETLAKVQKEKTGLEEAYKVLKASLLRAGERVIVTQGKLHVAECKIKDLEVQKAHIEQREDTNAAKSKEEFKIVQGKLASAEAKIKELEVGRDEFEKKLTRSQVLDTVRIRDLNFAKQSLEESRSQNEKLETTVEYLEKNMSSLQIGYAALKKENDSLKKEIVDVAAATNTVVASHDVLDTVRMKDFNCIKGRFEDECAQNSKLQMKNEELQNQNSKLQFRNDELENKLYQEEQNTRIKLTYADKHINEFECKNVRLEKSCSEKDGMIASLRSLNERLKTECDAKDEVISNLKSQAAILKDEIVTNLKTQNEILKKSNLDLTKENLELKNDVSHHVKQLDGLSRANDCQREITENLIKERDSQDEIMKNLVKEHEADLLVIENLHKQIASEQKSALEACAAKTAANSQLVKNDVVLKKFQALIDQYEDYIPIGQMVFRKIETFNHQICAMLSQIQSSDRLVCEADTLAHILQRIIEEICTKTLYQQL